MQAKRIQRKLRTTKPLPSIIYTAFFSRYHHRNFKTDHQMNFLMQHLNQTILLSSSKDHKSATIEDSSKSSSASSTPTNDRTTRVARSSSITTQSSNNDNDGLPYLSLHVRECLETFTRDWNVIDFKYDPYSGNWSELPKVPKITDQRLQDQVYEIDNDDYGQGQYYDYTGSNYGLNQNYGHNDNSGGILLKEGYIMKGSEVGSDSIFSVATKSFKKRWMILRQEIDGSSSVEFFKDQRKIDSKGSICMDLCHQIIRRVSNRKSGKSGGTFAFELRMIEGHKPCILATETESDLETWMESLNRSLNPGMRSSSGTSSSSSSDVSSSRRSVIFNDNNLSLGSDNTAGTASRSSPPATPKVNLISKSYNLMTPESMSRNPELVKYSRETESSIAALRKDSRVNVFSVYPDLNSRRGNFISLKCNLHQPAASPSSSPSSSNTCVKSDHVGYKENFGHRFLFTCHRIDFNLKTTVDGRLIHPEPFFTFVSIFHTKLVKLTEEFRFDVNDPLVKEMIADQKPVPSDLLSDSLTEHEMNQDENDFPVNWITNPISAIFSIHSPSPDMFLVMRIEKVLSGSLSSATDPYIKSTDSSSGISKAAIKLHKSSKSVCQRMGSHYRQPFAWAARPLFKPSKQLDIDGDFGPFYKQDSHKVSDEEIIKHLNELRQFEKPKNVTIIPGKISATVRNFESLDHVPNVNELNIVTPCYTPIEPFPSPIKTPALIEISEFLINHPRESYVFTEFVNLLFVHLKNLKYDAGSKFFPKTRNIAITVEFKDSDDDHSEPLRAIFSRPDCTMTGENLVKSSTSCVLHHDTAPDFYEEIKILLPFNLHERHHLLFTFYHVSCNNKGSSIKSADSSSGGSSMSSKSSNINKIDSIESPIGYSWIPISPLKGGRLNFYETSLTVAAHLPSGYLSYKPLGLGRGVWMSFDTFQMPCLIIS